MSPSLRLDRLLGHVVLTANNRSLGRLEEFRAERHGTALVVTAYVIGRAALFERLGVAASLVLGIKQGRGFLVRWDQLDLTNPNCPRLTCPVEEVQRL